MNVLGADVSIDGWAHHVSRIMMAREEASVQTIAMRRRQKRFVSFC